MRSLPRSIIAARHQSQADVCAGNGAVIQRQDGYFNDMQRFGAVIEYFRCETEPKSGVTKKSPELSARVISLMASWFFSGERNTASTERPVITHRST